METQVARFGVAVVFDADGEPDELTYRCPVCGKPSTLQPQSTVENLVTTHLHHVRDSHELEPPRLCAARITTQEGQALRCSIEAGTPHEEHLYRVEVS